MTEPAELDVEGYLIDPDAEMRRMAAAHWFATGMDVNGDPMPFVLGYEAVRAVLRDRRLSARSFPDDMRAAGLSKLAAEQFTPLFRRDGEDHRRLRAVLASAFTPRSVERLRPVAASVAARLGDDIVANGGRCEFVSAFASPLPPEVFAVLFGLPVQDRDELARWATAIAQAFAPGMTSEQVTEVESVAAEMRAHCEALIADRRAHPADDLVTGLLDAEVDGERLDDSDVIATISGFIFAGAETTKRQLTALVMTMADHPHAWEHLIADPDLVPNAVEEVLRHRPIVPGLTRVAIEPFARDDLELAPGCRLMTSFVTANHDRTAFDDPESFDVERPNASDHVTFGWGPHFCLGAGLARVELQEAVSALVARFGPPSIPEGGRGDPTALVAPDELLVEFPLR